MSSLIETVQAEIAKLEAEREVKVKEVQDFYESKLLEVRSHMGSIPEALHTIEFDVANKLKDLIHSLEKKL